jgi:superfamily II RNA helicase
VVPSAPKLKTNTETLADLNRREEITKQLYDRNKDARKAATQSGADTSALDAEHHVLDDTLRNIAESKADQGLLDGVWAERDAERLDELNAAIARQGKINEKIVEQSASVEAAEEALDDATAELARLKYKTSGGVFEAQQRLNRHRQQRPIGGKTS